MTKKLFLTIFFISQFLLTAPGAQSYFESYSTETVKNDPYSSKILPRRASYNRNSAEPDFVTETIAYPTGRRESSTLLLEKQFPSEAVVGESYTYKIKVTNISELTLTNIRVSETIKNQFEIIKTNPSFSDIQGDESIWTIETLAPGETAEIAIEGKANEQKDLPCCTKAEFDWPTLCNSVKLVKPALDVKITSTDQVLTCENIPIKIKVTNTGDSQLNDILIQSDLPTNVKTLEGYKTIKRQFTKLLPGKSETISAKVKALRTGQYRFVASAKSDRANAQEDASKTIVKTPQLTINASSNRDRQFVGRDFEFTLNVLNDGDVPTDDLVIEAQMPQNTTFISASNRGQYSSDYSAEYVQWNLKSLKARDSKRLKIKAKADSIGHDKLEVLAKARCTPAVKDTTKIRVEGIPALLLEVIDLEDPIEIGQTITYEITITNQGSADAKNVMIIATLDGMKYLSSTGKSRDSVLGNRVKFNPIVRLAPKDKATWVLKVRAEKVGDLRFKVEMTSDELTRPVEESESTFVY